MSKVKKTKLQNYDNEENCVLKNICTYNRYVHGTLKDNMNIYS